MGVYIEHFLFGLMFMVSGAYASQYCRHLTHRVAVGMILLVLETVIIVSVIG